MSQVLLFDESEMWHDHTDFYMDWLEEILNALDDSGIRYFIEVDLTYPDNIKKTKKFPICPEKKFFMERNKMILRKKYVLKIIKI